MKAIDVVLAYAKLDLEEQSSVNELLTIISKDRHALCILQNDALNLSADIRSEMDDVSSTNVVHVPFGTSKKPETRGRPPAPNGATALARKFLATNPNGSALSFRVYAMEINPTLAVATLNATFYKTKRRLAA